MTTGICTNLPSRCSKAAAKEKQPISAPGAVCAECSSPLQAVAERPAGSLPGAAVLGGIGLVGVLAVIALFFSFGRGPHNAGTTASGAYMMRLAGSNTIGSQLAPALVAAWLQSKGATDVKITARPGQPEKVVSATLQGQTVNVEIKAHGSATAFTALGDGSADVGMASRAIKPDEVTALSRLGDFHSAANEHVLGLDGVAVVIPTSNPIQKASLNDLQALFSGKTANWSSLGGPNTPVKIYARDDKSGTYDTFKELVLRGAKLGQAKRFEDSAQLEQSVADDPGGIGFIGLPYVKTTHPLAVNDGPAAPLLPTVFSVKTENYPLSRRLYLYTATSPTNANVLDFVRFALSPAGQKIVRDQQFVDLEFAAGGPKAPTVAASECRLSDRFPGDKNAYCQLRHSGEQLGTSFRFRTGSTELDTRAVADLQRVITRMKLSPDKQLVLAGFADGSGAYGANCALANSRAETVSKAFAAEGLNPKVISFCSELPVRANDSAAGRELNRRVELFLT
jgi:phosphate transport system substrate-binding protein